MKVKERYVVYGALRFTWGMAMMLIILSGIVGLIYLIYAGILTITPDDISWIIGFFVIMGLFSLFALYTDKTQKWHHYILEIYDDGWIHYMWKYMDTGDVDLEIYIKEDMLVGIGSYKKKYYPRKGKWYIMFDIGFTDGEKVYGPFFYGWLEEPKDIKQIDRLVEWIREKGAENVKRLGIKVPKAFAWYDVTTWAESEQAKKMNEEWEKHKKESAEQVR